MMNVIIYMSILCVGITGLQHNLFFQTHNLLHGNQTVCYPLARSVKSMFAVNPIGGTGDGIYWRQVIKQEKSKGEGKNQECRGIEGTFSMESEGHCWTKIHPTLGTPGTPGECRGGYRVTNIISPAMYGTTSPWYLVKEDPSCQFQNDNGTSHPFCHNGTGWVCTTVKVTQNYSCIEHHCRRHQCGAGPGYFKCDCMETTCLALSVGIQTVCGLNNGTHLVRGNVTFESPWKLPFKEQYRSKIPAINTCYRTKEGYVFLFNGTYTTAIRKLPTYFAVGVVSPVTVPCPLRARVDHQVVARTVCQEFCEDWKHTKTLGSDIGYGILSSLSHGGSAGIVSTKNRNYLTCGLTILGNETAEALKDINMELAELRLHAQQNRYAVDYILAQQGTDRVCTIVGDKCITNVHDYSLNITEYIDNLRNYVDGMIEGPKSGWWPFNLLGEVWGSIIHYGTIFILVLIILVRCILPLCRGCLLNRGV